MNLSLVRGCLTSLAGLPTHLAAYIPLFRVRTEGKLIDLFFGQHPNRCLWAMAGWLELFLPAKLLSSSGVSGFFLVELNPPKSNLLKLEFLGPGSSRRNMPAIGVREVWRVG